PTLEVGNTPVAIAAGDWDKDGNIDLVIVNSGSRELGILGNDGAGGFISESKVSLDHPLAVTAGDWDGDGNMDLAVIYGRFSFHMGILKNDGSGNFREANSVPVGSTPKAIITGDWDGDGDLYLAVVEGREVGILVDENSDGF